jgi:hypothetical protein
VRSQLILVALLACGGGARGPAKPVGPDPKQLSAQLHGDLVELGAIAKRSLGDCPALIGALRPHVTRMQEHADALNRAAKDPAFLSAWRVEADSYAAQKSQLTDAIAKDLAASYLGCKSDELLVVINAIPSW